MDLNNFSILSFLAGIFVSLILAIFKYFLHGKSQEKQFEYAKNSQEKQFKYDRTRQFIDEFYSDKFIKHRISMAKTKRNVENGDVSMQFIALGYIYPIDGKCYDGEEIHEYTEHQHLTLYFGFFERLAHSLKNDDLDVELIKTAFGYSFLWNNDFFMNMRRCALEIMDSREMSKNVKEPYFISSIETIESFLELNSSTINKIIPSKHYKLKEDEV